jgi:secreted trypsin-like serine protease
MSALAVLGDLGSHRNLVANGAAMGALNNTEFPYYVTLYGIPGSVACGGALIAPHRILTAASCAIAAAPSSGEGALRVYAEIGVRNTSVTIEDQESPCAELVEGTIVSHPDYNSTTGAYDVAAVTLNRTVTCAMPSSANYIAEMIVRDGRGRQRGARGESGWPWTDGRQRERRRG